MLEETYLLISEPLVWCHWAWWVLRYGGFCCCHSINLRNSHHPIIEDKNGGQGKGYPNPDQTFQAEFNELLFISIALKLNQNFVDSLMIRSRGSNASSPLILRKIHEGWAGKQFRLGLNFRGGETQFS